MDIESYNKKIKYYKEENKKVENITITVLYNFYFMIINKLIQQKYVDKNFIELTYTICKILKMTLNNCDNYKKIIHNKKIRRYIKNIMKNYNLNIIYDKYVKTDKIMEFDYTDELNYLILKYPNIKYSINTHKQYKININEINDLILKQSIEVINILKEINSEFMNYEISIINQFVKKINKYYICLKKFNNDELFLYDKLMNYKDNNNTILYIFNHFALPICRYEKHPLIADFLILSKFDDKLKFAIIEFDGPTHYDINNYLFNKDTIIRDVIKNNFCIYNNISILRINNVNDLKLEYFMMNLQNIQYDIPPYNYYLELFNNINNNISDKIYDDSVELDDIYDNLKSLSETELNNILEILNT